MHFVRVVAGVIVVAAISLAGIAHAQVAGTESEPKSNEPDTSVAADAEAPAELPDELLESRVMDEITVIGGPQAKTAFDLEMERQALMREAVFADMRMRERAEEEQAWRQADPDLKNPESRIKWGYSPQAELRMRRDNDFMHELPIDQHKPASIFRAEF